MDSVRFCYGVLICLVVLWPGIDASTIKPPFPTPKPPVAVTTLTTPSPTTLPSLRPTTTTTTTTTPTTTTTTITTTTTTTTPSASAPTAALGGGGGGGSDLGAGIGIGIGVTLCVMGLVVAVVVVVVWRRGWVLPCAASSEEGRPLDKDSPSPTVSNSQTSFGAGNLYDGLQMDGRQSVGPRLYEGLNPSPANPKKQDGKKKKKTKPGNKAEKYTHGGGGGQQTDEPSLDSQHTVYQNWQSSHRAPGSPPDTLGSSSHPQQRPLGGGGETLAMTGRSATTTATTITDPDTVQVSVEEVSSTTGENLYENANFK